MGLQASVRATLTLGNGKRVLRASLGVGAERDQGQDKQSLSRVASGTLARKVDASLFIYPISIQYLRSWGAWRSGWRRVPSHPGKPVSGTQGAGMGPLAEPSGPAWGPSKVRVRAALVCQPFFVNVSEAPAPHMYPIPSQPAYVARVIWSLLTGPRRPRRPLRHPQAAPSILGGGAQLSPHLFAAPTPHSHLAWSLDSSGAGAPNAAPQNLGRPEDTPDLVYSTQGSLRWRQWVTAVGVLPSVCV